MFDLSTQPLHTLYATLQNHLSTHESITFKVLNPDVCDGVYNGNKMKINNKEYIYRGYKTWIDLAHQLHCKMLTPQLLTDHCIALTYKKLHKDSFHTLHATPEEKYGVDSIFSKIHKNEESSFLHYYQQALKNVHIDTRKKILNLGINNGDEFALIKQLTTHFSSHQLYGIDYCQSAIDEGKVKFKNDPNIHLYTHDINELETLNLTPFDLLISIGTLQSSNLEFHKLFISLVQKYLKKDGAIILGFPNCRWVDGEMIYGAMMKNYPFSEMSNLYKDVNFCKKYLQKKRFRVTITGKDYIFLTATSIG